MNFIEYVKNLSKKEVEEMYNEGTKELLEFNFLYGNIHELIRDGKRDGKR